MPNSRIPEGWLPCSKIGKPVKGTRFLPFKVPLKEVLCYDMSPDLRFTPSMLLQLKPDLRLVIDLTNTPKYYNKYEFIEKGVKHEKIFCPGRMVPPLHLLKRFFNVVDDFMNSPDAQDKYIGVHCTHGINRTGYFICSYMIHRLGMAPKKAIKAFQKARGHEMERKYLVDELFKSTSNPNKKTSSEELPENSGQSIDYLQQHKKRHSDHDDPQNSIKTRKINKLREDDLALTELLSKRPKNIEEEPIKNDEVLNREPISKKSKKPKKKRDLDSPKRPSKASRPPKEDPFERKSQLDYYVEEEYSRIKYNKSRKLKND